MDNRFAQKFGFDSSQKYQIRVKGHLDSRLSERFDGLSVVLEKNGETLLTGEVADQAALFGLIKKVRDLGIPLISVIPVTIDHPDQ